MENGIHIGNIIKAEFERIGRRGTWLALQLSCNRANVYSIFSHANNIDTEMLIKLSVALQHNFFQDIANLIDDKICPNSSDNTSKRLLQNVQKLDTKKIGREEDKE